MEKKYFRILGILLREKISIFDKIEHSLNTELLHLRFGILQRILVHNYTTQTYF